MKILWLSPWLRPLARAYAGELRAAGDEVLLVTSDQHPQPAVPLPWELVLDPRPKSPASWPSTAAAALAVRRFDPDVVVTELVRDPRWLGFARSVPRVSLIHDDQPHGPEERRPRWEERLFDRWNAGAVTTVCFSEYVARRVEGTPGVAGRLATVPLTSDLPEEIVPRPVEAGERRDFVLIGRLNEYKNLPRVLEAWDAHQSGPHHHGDRLRLFGAAATEPVLPRNAWWNGGSYDYLDLLAPLSRAKGSVVHYQLATQSGVQVLSMQLGVSPIVSTRGGLPEFQPARPRPIDPDDVGGLVAAFDQLADPEWAWSLGMHAHAHYAENFHASVAAARLRAVLQDTVDHAAAARVRPPAVVDDHDVHGNPLTVADPDAERHP
ncbi:glycosyltransferase [Gordonia soli]|uniref:Glycosyltransferase subfamily 4-like N-terminal domain-containing protein n=1 Tax=Gordonia soli NBRC 108243 TaxID=1223545 RepID=M0QFU8_9ACTN|nr:glycosyltransferase [Gordonia soli]GAC67485.1 hypothetical protein GS4_08_00690 [Gordonia soli NBRC 108243]